MPISKEMRLLESRWKGNQGWPQRLEWVEIHGIRGWIGQRIELPFPITAIVGENGVGKSTILQAIAASFKGGDHFASDFFPDTPWEDVENAEIRASHRESPTSGSVITSLRKPTKRWRGNEERKDRPVEYQDLRRIQPMVARIGYARMAKKEVKETSFEAFDVETIERFSRIMGRDYTVAKLSTTDADDSRTVPVVTRAAQSYSGFHSGAGEIVMAELLPRKIKKFSILLIDEVETSLHPRTQRRLIRDLATMCRNREMQCIMTTHSPYVLDELPPEGRIYLMESEGQKRIVSGVSPAFAMTRMDDEIYPEADIYLEDERSATLLNEIVTRSQQKDVVVRYQTVPFGAASVGRSLGQMVKERRFRKASVVFLDGDQDPSDGCLVLPGGDAPERVIFEGLAEKGTDGVAARIGRSPADVADCCAAASLLKDHHEWVKFAADRLSVTGDVLWQAMCAEWCVRCLEAHEAEKIGDAILTAIVQHGGSRHIEKAPVPTQASLNLL